MTPVQAISKATELLGGPSKFARLLGVSSQTIVFWRKNRHPVPPEQCLVIEDLTDGQILCEDLRPDVQWRVILRRAKRKAA